LKAASTLDDIELFVAVIAAGSFSEAGRRLGLTASSVARRMDELEAELGTRLLTRSTRRLGLTEAGTIFHERAARISAELAEAKAVIAGLDDEPRGTLRIDASVAFGSRHVAPTLGELVARHPQLSVELSVNDSHIDMVESGVDLAIRLGILPDSGLVASKLAPLRRAVVGSPDYLSSNGRPETPNDLLRHECLVMQNCAGASRSWHFRDGRNLKPVAVKGRVKANNAEALVATAIAGAGLAHLPTWLVYQEITAGSLIPLLGSYEALDEDQGGIYAVRPAARTPSAKLRVFVDLLRARFGNPPYWDRTRESLEDSSIKQASSSPGHLKLVAGTKLHEL